MPVGGTRREVPPALRILSLGGGVQSTVLALLAEQGHFGQRPDYAIFADTKWEPRSVYDNLDWLETQVSFPIRRVSNGRSLREDVLSGVNAQGQPWLTIPAYLADSDGQSLGINWRQCTKNYKLAPIYRAVYELLGLRPRQHLSSETRVEMWLGITTDEAGRMRSSRDWWVRHRYPLVAEHPMSRVECKEWFAREYPGRPLTRSACIGCPFRGSRSWLQVSRSDPEGFAETVELDDRLRTKDHNAGRLFRKRAFLHHRRIPLRDAILLDREEEDYDGFLNECEGHCGL